MRLGSPATLALAVAIAAPALWHAFVVQDLPPSTALLRFLIAVPVSAAMLAVLRALTAPYRRPPERIQAVAERLDVGSEAPTPALPPDTTAVERRAR
jgi:hypothetical protein